MAEITIREVRPEDAEEILAYLRQVGSESDNLTFGAEGLPATAQQEAGYIQSVLDNPKAVMYGVWVDGVLCAQCGLSPLPRRTSHRAEVGISVVKAHWGTGLGSLMMQRMIDFAKANGLEILNLEVRSDNLRAIRLYQKFGFQTIGTFPAFVKVGSQYADAELMYLDLR